MINLIKDHLDHAFFLGVMLMGVILIVMAMISIKVERERNVIRKYIKGSYKEKGVLDRFLDENKHIQEREEINTVKYAILNEKYTPRQITKIKLFGALMGFLFSVLIRNVIMIPIMTAIAYNLPDLFFNSQSYKKRNKLQAQLGLAIRFFVSEYTTSRSVVVSLQNIIPKLPEPIRHEFERLTREFNSGIVPKEALENFAIRINNKFGYIFTRLLISYFDQGTEFGPHLIRLGEDITEDELSMSEGRTELAMVKTTNYIMNAAVFISLIAIFLVVPERGNEFQSTVQGQMLLAVSVGLSIISVALGLKMGET